MITVGVFAAILSDRNQILCVKRGYGSRNWTLPGGQIEKGESPERALKREVFEESVYEIKINHLVGLYWATFRDDVAILFETAIIRHGHWHQGTEISEIGFFKKDKLPKPMNNRMVMMIHDAFERERGVLRVFEKE